MAPVSELRDYQAWHQHYDDPGSGLSWRLRTVQRYLTEALERQPGPVRALSVCSGDGRDLIEVLARREDAARVTATLLELHPDIAESARGRAAAAGLSGIEVRTVDAGFSDAYVGAVPADLVLLVGIFGNICDDEVFATIDAAPQLCRPGATLIWSRGRFEEDQNDAIRARFAGCGFAELDYATHESESRPALGAVQYRAEPQALVPGRRLFTFVR